MTGCGCIATVLHFVYVLTVRSHKHYSNKALEVLGNRGTRACISGGQGNTCIKMRGTGTKAILGNREHRKQAIYFGGKREQVPPGRVSILTWWYWSTLKWSCVNIALYTELCIFTVTALLRFFRALACRWKCVNFVLIVICSLKIVGNLTIFKFIIPFYSCVEKPQANLICV